MNIELNGQQVALQQAGATITVNWQNSSQQLNDHNVYVVIDGGEPVKVAAYGGPNYYDFYFQTKCGRNYHCNNGYIGMDNIWQAANGDVFYVLTMGVDVANKAGILC